jgi:DNA-directed RNA polymerase specialized sigma subunit
MTIEELYEAEKLRIKKLSIKYGKLFNAEREDLFQEGALALAEAYRNYAYKLTDEELLRLTHRVINRRMYKYAKNEFKYKSTLN